MREIADLDIKGFQGNILRWYRYGGRHVLPWRKRNLSSYKIIIAEVLLQRTKSEKVKDAFEPFIKEYPSWDSIVKKGICKLEEILKPLGLQKQRANRLFALALIMKATGGKFPENSEGLYQLPMFGQYLAYAVKLQVYKQPKPLLDVNMARVLERYFGKRTLADLRYDPYLQDLAHRVVRHPKSKCISWAILDFANSTCKARGQVCHTCPITESCQYFNSLKL